MSDAALAAPASSSASPPRFVVTGQRARQMRVIPSDVLKRLYTRSDRAGFVQTAAHLAVLVAGRKVADGPPGSVLKDPEVERAYLGQ